MNIDGQLIRYLNPVIQIKVNKRCPKCLFGQVELSKRNNNYLKLYLAVLYS